MSNYIIQKPMTLRATISLPSSKSICNRALILGALSGSPYEINRLSDCDDTAVLVRALRSEGNHFDIGAAGTAMRFLTAYLAHRTGSWTITGTERMKNRPIALLVEALRSLGAEVSYLEKEGYPPLRIEGRPLTGGKISLAGGVSSQYISALLMVAPCMQQGLTLHLEGNIISRPYIQLTLALMRQFGAVAEWEGQDICVQPGGYRPIPFTVESDWSAASYWYEQVALSEDRDAKVFLEGLFPDSLQGDAAGAKLFAKLGVETCFTETGVCLTKRPVQLERVDYNFINEPDLAQTFVVTCALLGVPFCFTGLQSLKIKETDRIAALCAELRKLGILLQERDGNSLTWNGERCEPDPHPVIATYEDHRMAMAFAPVSLLRPNGIEIAHPEVVSKSYPHYWEDLLAAGFRIDE